MESEWYINTDKRNEIAKLIKSLYLMWGEYPTYAENIIESAFNNGGLEDIFNFLKIAISETENINKIFGEFYLD